jgi:GNAT superfamily N-acetyltransferase
VGSHDSTVRRVDLTFRPAGLDDVAPLLALVTSAYRGEQSRAGWTTEADLLDGQRTDAPAIARIVTGRDSLILVAESPDVESGAAGPGLAGAARPSSIVACCQLERRGPGAYFGMFAVRPTAQAGGIGSALLAEAERYALEAWGAAQLEMQVIAQREELIAWYVRRGYRPTGATKPFPYGDERFGLPKRSDLAFTVLAKPLAAR